MNSLFVRLTLWGIATWLVCVAGFTVTDDLRVSQRDGEDFLSKFLTVQVSEARQAFVDGGQTNLGAFFSQLQSHFPGTYRLLDRNGRDVLTGEDRHLDLHHNPLPRMWRIGSDRVRIVWPDENRRFFLAAETVFPAGPPSPVPYYVWLLVAGIGFCLVPAYQIASPLRTLSNTVEKFGYGELDARVNLRIPGLKGRDELGRLARSFNVMAERIQTLLTAERRLLMDVSHELRSPLARLKFAVQLARTNPNRQQSLDRIERDVDRLTVLVSDLLHVTRAESDPGARASEPVDLKGLLAEVEESAHIETQARHCYLKLICTERLSVDGDRELLHRAVENVVRNAIRFSPEGSEIQVKLSREQNFAISDAAEAESSGKSHTAAVITIRDHGPGVPEAAIHGLFQPFFRVEADRNRTQGGGFGLGLSIAQRAVSLHGGTISARNAHPGLLVEIKLPNAIEEPAEIAPERLLARAAHAHS